MKSKMAWKQLLTLCSVTLALVCLAETRPVTGGTEPRLTLVTSVMCEGITNYLPVYPAVVFSLSQGQIFCFTAFDPVLEQTHIYHRWYRRDTLISNARLTLNPPKWSSASSMQLRDGDTGAWRVEIVDASETLLKTLRFSISD